MPPKPTNGPLISAPPPAAAEGTRFLLPLLIAAGLLALVAGALLTLLVTPTLAHLADSGEGFEDPLELLAVSAFDYGLCSIGETILRVVPAAQAWTLSERLRCFDAHDPTAASRIRAEACPPPDEMPEEGIAPLYRSTPIYPAAALEDGLEGRVLIEYTIDDLGYVQPLEVLADEGEVFIAPALHALTKWVYCVAPGAKPAGTRHRIAIPFRLGNESDQ